MHRPAYSTNSAAPHQQNLGTLPFLPTARSSDAKATGRESVETAFFLAFGTH